MSGRTRKFDWDEARRLYADGVPIRQIAERMNVSWSGVQRVVVPGSMERARASTSAWHEANRQPCVTGCGNTVTYVGARYHKGHCRRCASLARGTTARDTELQCMTCREWKPDDDFPRDLSQKYARRGRAVQCRVCQTVARQEYRERHKVPCVGCGAPALPPNEKTTHGAGKPRCRSCLYEWMRLPEQREASRRRFLDRVRRTADRSHGRSR